MARTVSVRPEFNNDLTLKGYKLTARGTSLRAYVWAPAACLPAQLVTTHPVSGTHTIRSGGTQDLLVAGIDLLSGK